MEEMVPPQYRRFLKVFSKEASDRMPQHKPHDHGIQLKKDSELSRSKAYPMSPNEQEELNDFIQDNLKKGYILLGGDRDGTRRGLLRQGQSG